MRIRAQMGTLYDGELFTAVYASAGCPALPPWRWRA
jgi:hypothetical protein